MKRSGIIAFMIVALALGTTATLSAAPMSQWSGMQGTNHQKWIGKTTTDLLVQLGVPNFTTSDGNGDTTLKYIYHENIGRGNPVEMVQQFDVNQNGRVISEQVYQI
jgi:hypothetical protein